MEYKTLEKLQFGLEYRVKPFLLDATVDVSLDREIDMLVARIKGSLFSEQVDIIEIEYPADWWQAFKQRWFPEWAKQRWPIEMMHHRIDVKAAYPDFKYSVPGTRLMVVERDWWREEESALE